MRMFVIPSLNSLFFHLILHNGVATGCEIFSTVEAELITIKCDNELWDFLV